MKNIEKVARILCEDKGYNPDALEPGDAICFDGTASNGDPAHFLWRDFTRPAEKILQALGIGKED